MFRIGQVDADANRLHRSHNHGGAGMYNGRLDRVVPLPRRQVARHHLHPRRLTACFSQPCGHPFGGIFPVSEADKTASALSECVVDRLGGVRNASSTRSVEMLEDDLGESCSNLGVPFGCTTTK